jgi:ABC-2 type transport system ATP-binding protein
MNTEKIQLSASTPPIVSVENLSKAFRDFWWRTKVRAVSNVSFKVLPGEVFGLLGPNGSGKTTILKLILNLLRPDSGRISLFGMPPYDVKSKARIGYLPEDTDLYPFLSSQEILNFYGKLFKLSRNVRLNHLEQLLEMVGLSHARHRPLAEFSKGMVRRIGLAQALINDPDLVILDEPTSGLDPEGCRQVKDLITTIARRGKSVILCSHLLADVENVCDRVAILCDGSIIVQGRVRDLLEQQESFRLIFQSLPQERLDKVLSMIYRETGLQPEVEHPSRKLEQFFLETIRHIGRKPVPPTGAVATRQVAEYLSKGQEKLGKLAHTSPIKPTLSHVQAPPAREPAQEQTADEKAAINRRLRRFVGPFRKHHND